ncbi:MAG: S9 family peptidase [Verrucomicrobiae bacterium]|nr:S9 family peptidase [Verrucomicrobiae bacterium]
MAQLPPLIPREVLFGNPERIAPRLAPDGRSLAWLAPDTNNVLQIWVRTVGQQDDRIVTADRKRGIRIYHWARNSRMLLYLQDTDGDEDYQIHGVDLASGNVRNFTAIQGVRADIVATHRDFPDEVLVSLNARDRTVFDVHRLNIVSGALTPDTENPGDVVDWTPDALFRVRGATVATADGGTELRIRDEPGAPWKTLLTVGPDEILALHGFSADGRSVYLESSLGRDTTALLERNLATGTERVIAASPEVDLGSVLIHPVRRTVEAVSFEPGRSSWRVIDPAVQADFDGIRRLHDGDFFIGSRSDADDRWLVAFTTDRGSTRYYAWDRAAKSGELLFTAQPRLDTYTLAPMKPVAIRARDGLTLHSYLTLPVGVPPTNLPMVLNVHGGPWARDTWGLDPTAQWYANRGYAVLQVNFRGSTGYGKNFLNAGNRQWGLKMHDDLIDAVRWAVDQRIANPARVAITGGSYGGYATLAGLAFTPDVFACGVDIVGPSNLETLLRSIPPYWKPVLSMFNVRIGNVNDPADAELIRNASPLFRAHQIQRPLLIGQGANDPRVKQPESEQIVAAIEKNGGSVVYVLYPDEGHGFARPENRLDFQGREEQFLARHLGGRYEPMTADPHPGSSAVVRILEPRPR